MNVTMFSTTRDLFCKFKLVKNFNRRVSSSFSCRRSYAANELNFGGEEISSKPKFVPCGGASFVQNFYNPTWEMSDVVYGSQYCPAIYKALHIEASKALEAGANVVDLKHGVEAARNEVCAYIRRTARVIHTPEEIAEVSTAFANGDTEIGNCVAKGLEKVGKYFYFMIADKKELKTDVEFVNEWELQGWQSCSPHFFTNKREKICLLKSPSVFLLVNKMLNKKIVQDVQLAMRSANPTEPRPLLIIAEDVEKGLEESLLSEESCSSEKLCVIKPTELLLDRITWRETMEDLAILTGGQVAIKEFDMDFIPQMLGSCKKVRLSQGMMLIYDAAGDQKDIEKRREQLRSAIESSIFPFTAPLKKRFHCLSQMLRFKVGKDINPLKVYKVARDTRSAMWQGIFPGGGVALLNASKELDKLQVKNSDMRLGVQLLQNALKMPLYCIASAAGFDGSVVVGKLLEQDNADLGYDPASGEYIEMTKSGHFNTTNFLLKELECAVSLFNVKMKGYFLPMDD